MSEAIGAGAGGLAALERAYFSRRYTLLFYSLLLTIAAGPLFVSIGFDTDLIDWFLAVQSACGRNPDQWIQRAAASAYHRDRGFDPAVRYRLA